FGVTHQNSGEAGMSKDISGTKLLARPNAAVSKDNPTKGIVLVKDHSPLNDM
ncbi:hypothetical protein Tco_0195290, partial [Tanacetum coccineum]